MLYDIPLVFWEEKVTVISNASIRDLYAMHTNKKNSSAQ
jgi:hypothetical protein